MRKDMVCPRITILKGVLDEGISFKPFDRGRVM
jgi:hypothetical protein